jgi:hypothetical protein
MKEKKLCKHLSVVLAALAVAPVVVANGNSAKTPHSVWQVSSTTNALTGEVTTIATAYGSRWTADVTQHMAAGLIPGLTGVKDSPRPPQTVAVRQIGQKLECFVITGEFMANGVYNFSNMGYKFDDGPIGHHFMGLSQDHLGLFYDDDLGGFIRRMAKAHTLVIEYEPYQKGPQTATFDVSSFPSDKFVIPPEWPLSGDFPEDCPGLLAPCSSGLRLAKMHPRPGIKQAPRPRIKQAPKVFVPSPTE